ncbi:MAG: extracellular solute-binding protein [Fusobacteriaceae bacterium]|jgi:spermidine/putrescine transport system substrate-binding protein|nr:extracellular solute-binding protein [Fusobacteriaceae bacterium]
MLKKILLVGLLIISLVSCQEKKSEDKTLYIYNWAEYIPTEVYDQFEKETGIKIVEDTYSTNEELFTKLKAGGDGYDLVIPSADYYEIMMKENMLEKLDKSKISTFKNINGEILNKLQEFDPNNDYGIPYVINPTVIAINTKYVHDYPTDFTIFEREDLRGRMTLLDDMREVMTAALAMDGNLQTTKEESAIAKAAERVKAWKKNIAKFDSESFGKGFATGEFWVVHGYIDNISREIDDEMKENTKFILPTTGAVACIDSFVLLKTAPHKDAAHKFIEFIHRPEIYAIIADYLNCPSINVPAEELMKTEPEFTIEEINKAQILRDIYDTLEIQNKYWQEIML